MNGWSTFETISSVEENFDLEAQEAQYLVDRVRRLETNLEMTKKELASAKDKINSLERLSIDLCRSVGIKTPVRNDQAQVNMSSNIATHECGPAC